MTSKPMIEKRRRARINGSLNELKAILLKAFENDVTHHHSKLEKADILEMTVKYLKRLERQRGSAMTMDPDMVNKYKAGFSECRNEVMKFLSTNEGVTGEIRTRLLQHLAERQNTMEDESGAAPEYFTVNSKDVSWNRTPFDESDAGKTRKLPPSKSDACGVGDSERRSHSQDIRKRPARTPSPKRRTALLHGPLEILPDRSAIKVHSSNRFQASLDDIAIIIPSGSCRVAPSRRCVRSSRMGEISEDVQNGYQSKHSYEDSGCRENAVKQSADRNIGSTYDEAYTNFFYGGNFCSESRSEKEYHSKNDADLTNTTAAALQGDTCCNGRLVLQKALYNLELHQDRTNASTPKYDEGSACGQSDLSRSDNVGCGEILWRPW